MRVSGVEIQQVEEFDMSREMDTKCFGIDFSKLCA